MTFDEILEYPYNGKIIHVVAGKGDSEDTYTTLYEGVMDEHMQSDENGRVLQTSDYIISIPLTKDDSGNWVVPRKGDWVVITRYGETFSLEVNNAEPSQLGGVSIYATRKSWTYMERFVAQEQEGSHEQVNG